ncbi:MAG TPA: RICIN domain-containing protein [Burkholderiaceae bacterium]|nr:RICIN domain-containing protein [Burkholderiaceae bacterium]
MKPIRSLIAAGATLAALAIPAATQAQSVSPLQSSATGQCMDVSGASQTVGANVIQWACASSSNQQWQAATAGGYTTFKAAHSGQCLDVSGASTQPGAAAIQWSCTGSANQQFTMRAQGAGFALVARHSGLCLGLENNATAQGTRITQQTCNGAATQTWNSQAPGGAILTAAISSATSLCMDVAGASQAGGTSVIQSVCANVPDQQWQLALSNGAYSMKVSHSGQCLDVYGASTSAGAPLIQWPCGGGANQRFTIQAQRDGYALMATHSGLCVGLENGGTATGTRLTQQACNGSASQTWMLPGLGSDPARRGSWSAPQTLSLVPVAAANLPNGKVLFWSAYDRFRFGGDNGKTYTSIWDPVTGAAGEALVTNTGHDMFCPGIANLPDGRIHVTGGSSSSKTSLYDPASGSWSAASPMNIPRGYQGSVTLSSGDVLTIGGSWSGGTGNKDAEVWSLASGTWRRPSALLARYLLTGDSNGVYRSDNHAWLFAASNGRVFHAGPSKAMHWFDTAGIGAVTAAGNRGTDGDAMNGNAIMFDIGRILTVGGAPNYENSDATSNAHLIDISGSTPTVTKLPSMAYARAFSNSVVLPDGKVVVVGGQSFTVVFSDDRAVLAPELFDPVTKSFSVMAPMSMPRTYHSVALLLADARVVSGGGGLCGSCTTNHPNVQVWSPPYLFNADGSPARRPVLTSAPTQANAGGSIAVTTDTPVAAFSLVRLSSATHSVNNEQRRVPLSFAATGTNAYALALPADRGILVPGYYMLFALDSAGVPSVARIVRIS